MNKIPVVVKYILIPLSIAALSVACANTDGGSGGDTPAVDAGSGSGVDGGADGGTAGGTDAVSSGDKDAGGGGSTANWSTKQVLEESHLAQKKESKCPAFTNGPKEIKVSNLVAVSPWTVASKGKLDGIYAQQKGGGAWSGIYVVGETAGAIAGLKPGDTFTAVGDITVFYCATQLNAKLVSKDGGTELPVAATVTLDKIGEDAKEEDRLSYEDAYLSIENVTVEDPEANGSDDKYHGDMMVVDATGHKLRIRTGFDTSFSTYDKDTKTWSTTHKKGDKLKSLRGVYIFAYGAWQIDPFEDAGLVWE